MISRFLASAALGASLLAAPQALAQTPPDAPATGAAAPSAAEVDGQLTRLFGDPAPFKAFLGELQTATAAEDKKAVAAMVAYPFKTKVDGKDVTFEKAADLQKAYDDVFTPRVLLAIKSQAYEALYANDMGVMVGSGQVWFALTGETDDKAVRIIGINQM